MGTFLLLAIFFSLLGVVLMIIYLIDRIHSMEKISQLAGQRPGGDKPPVGADERFEGLAGESLWRALAGEPTPGWNEEDLAKLRTFYEPVLLRHVMELFELGQLDSRQGIQMQPEADRMVRTPYGQIASWLPSSEARAIYDLGQDRQQRGDQAIGDIRERLDAMCKRLRINTGLPAGPGISRILLPLVELPQLPPAEPAPGVGTAPEQTAQQAVAATGNNLPQPN
jgi:hypothetical protein